MLNKFHNKMKEIKSNIDLADFIKKDEKLYNRIVEINKKLNGLELKDLTKDQELIINDVLEKIEKKHKIYNNTIIINNFMKSLEGIVEGINGGIYFIEDFDPEIQKFIKLYLK